MPRKRAMTSEKARAVRQQGHDDAKEFARLIGLSDDYQNDPKAKKDVVDANGDAHSVKSGTGYWQIFLYGESRFEDDSAFRAMNGIGQIMLECIRAIPSKHEYDSNKMVCKQKIAEYMKQLLDKLQERYRLEAFLEKSIFEGSQVSYLTVKHNDTFHIFWHKDVINVLLDNLTIANSGAREGLIPCQKVLFKLNGKNCGEIEMRNGEAHHHREMKFRLHKKLIVALLLDKIKDSKPYNSSASVIAYGEAIKKFIK
ncbi:hypothetical protein AGMMS49941_04260 [Deferribacterales bacterium]|nr:hypothetical protein AGMMS49941_04260 [Deferribacterales bacterium]